MTIFEWLKTSQTELQNSPTARLDCEILLCHMLNKQKSYLITHEQEELNHQQEEQLRELVEKRKAGMPIAYLIQSKAFFGRNFYVDENVLIPRPETEELLEKALEILKKERGTGTILDLGTGSGALAISIALELPQREVMAIDISDEAIEVAEKNQKTYPCDNLSFIHDDLLSNLDGERVSQPLSIIANLPYIGSETHRHLSEETEKYEPSTALYGGPDGLDLYRRLWKQLDDKKLEFTFLIMEISDSQANIAQQEAQEAFPNKQVKVLKDLSGQRRGILVHAKDEREASPIL